MSEASEIARRFVEALNAGHPDALAQLLARDYVQHSVGGPSGRQGVVEHFKGILTGFPGARSSVEDVVTDGKSLVGRFSTRGTHRGVFMGIAPTGREIEIRTIDIWRLKDGLLAEHWGESNLADILAELKDIC